jgi:3-deoxy-7-phosphoheptulonate synthase
VPEPIHPTPAGWTPDSWRSLPDAQPIAYPDAARVADARERLAALPPLVTSWEIERLRQLLAEAQEGKRFVLQGGDCAESFADCRPPVITSRLKILLQMSLVLVHGGKKPVVRIGRFAGQYSKPRSSPTETRTDGAAASVTLPSYFGDLINRPEFTPEARRPDPELMLRGHHLAALTLNFVRSLVSGGFADIHHPENWDLAFFRTGLSPERREQYERMTRTLADGLRFMEALGERAVDDLTRVEFFTSHEGLNLHYESAQTRGVPRREGVYDLSTHLPWIGERTRDPRGAHAHFFAGVQNPVGVKLGPRTTPDELSTLAALLNPANIPGKLVLITRLGAGRAAQVLPPLVERAKRDALRVLWVCDPMHGNNLTTRAGIKTRSYDDIARETEETFTTLAACGTHMGGLHVELTGEDVTECIGGASGVTEDALRSNYATLCDPRLNFRQALELAFLLAERMSRR